MSVVRRGYIYLAAVFSLEAATWSVIFLLRGLLYDAVGEGPAPREATAVRLAVAVIAVPLYLAHWRWAQRLADRDADERSSAVRGLYLYGLMALFLIPLLANLHSLLAALIFAAMLGGDAVGRVGRVGSLGYLAENVAAIVVLGALWSYHRAIAVRDSRLAPLADRIALVRRTYVLGFSAVGMGLVAVGSIQLLRWLLFRIGVDPALNGGGSEAFATEVARLAVGLPVWLVSWRRAQELARGPERAERESALRLFYLYASLLALVLVGVGNAAAILAGAFRQALGLESIGDIRDPLPVVLVLGAAWLYFARVVREEAARPGRTERQAAVRRLYRYLIAGVAAGALLFGIGGIGNVLLGTVAVKEMTLPLKEQLAWSAAAVVAGLAVWVAPWRRIQRLALSDGRRGSSERSSPIRKLYLYFYLFVATITVLSAAVYVVARIFMQLLGVGGTGDWEADLPRSIAYGLVGVGVWIYHGAALRKDEALAKRDLAARLASVRAVVLDVSDGAFGAAVRAALSRDLPELEVTAMALNPRAVPALGALPSPEAAARAIGEADLIVGPWEVAVPAAADEDVPAELATAVATAMAASQAPKLLAPHSRPGWHWAGVEDLGADAVAFQTVASVRRLAAGEPLRAEKPLGAGALVGITIGVVVLSIIVGVPIFVFLAGSGLGYLF